MDLLFMMIRCLIGFRRARVCVEIPVVDRSESDDSPADSAKTAA